jgi:hypothetical protein
MAACKTLKIVDTWARNTREDGAWSGRCGADAQCMGMRNDGG